MAMAEENSTSRIPFVRTEDLLERPAVGKPLMFGAAAALLGAAVWGLLIIYAHVELGWLAWGIGALVGFAVIKGGGHGKALAVCAAILTLLAIGSGKHIAFQSLLATETEQHLEYFDEAAHLERRTDATDWVALGGSPSSRQIETYLEEHNFDTTVAEFLQYQAPALERFATNPPTLEAWREELRSEIAASYSFIDYLRYDLSMLDLLFAILGIVTAFSFVSRATTEMQVAARQEIREQRRAKAPEGPKAAPLEESRA